MDLFTPAVESTRFHPAFVNVLKYENIFTRSVINEWAEGFVDRDNKIVTEFQTTFDSSFWELYLHAVLKKLGAEIDFSVASPDFVVTSPLKFSIEATVALHPHDGVPATEQPDLKVASDFSEFNRQSIIRLANSIAGKRSKFIESYTHLPHVKKKPFLVAIAPFDRPAFNLQSQRAIEAFLFGYYVDETTRSREEMLVNGPEIRQIDHVLKDSGSRIEVGVFNNPNYSEISAVVFSSCATWSKVTALSHDPGEIVFETIHYNPTGHLPKVSRHHKNAHDETLLDGLRIYHNPFASHPFSTEIFSDPRIYQTHFDHYANEWRYQMSSQNLLFRRCIRFQNKT